MKQFNVVMFLSALLLGSCSSGGTDPAPGHETPPGKTHTMQMALDDRSIATLAAADITDVGIYIFLGDEKIFGEMIPLGTGSLDIEVPLGESLKTFAVAGAGSIEDSELLSTIKIGQDADCSSEIYLSEIKTFLSDKSVATVALELHRVVGNAVLQPTETSDQLSGLTKFDALNVTFKNVVTAFMPATGVYTVEDVTIATNLSKGFVASVYSFPTGDNGACMVDLAYMKGTQQVNATIRSLDAAIRFEPSKRTIVDMAILNEDYLEGPFTRSQAPYLTITEYNY